jgi:hypothetical protein
MLRIDGNGTPAERRESFHPARLLDRGWGDLVPHEDHRETSARLGAQRLRDRKEEASAVAGLPVGRDRTAVAHPAEPLDQRIDDAPRRPAVQVGDEPDPAGVTLEAGIVELRRDR